MTFKIITVAAIAALGFTTPAFAQSASVEEITENDGDPGNEPEFADMDYDAFSKGYDKNGMFDAMDADKDGVISRDEQRRSEFARYDTNQDGRINSSENDAMVDAITKNGKKAN